jgi:hypothetical protein
MKFRQQTLRGAYLVNMHIEMPRKVDMDFVKQPSDPRGGGLRPLGPP